MPQTLIEIRNIKRNFDNKEAVRGVNLKVNQGEIYALIGPNGAGKTTLTKMLVGLLPPSSGTCLLAGFDIQTNPLDAKKNFAYLPDNPFAYDHLSGLEFLYLSASLLSLPSDLARKEISSLSKIFPIKEILEKPMADYSRGNRQKVAFLSMLLGTPKILVIDEPIVGLDPLSITIFGEVLKQFVKKGGCVFLVTHTLSFAQKYAAKVALMDHGKIILEKKITKSLNLEKIYAANIKSS